MKKYYKELIIMIIQLFMFYISPLFAGPTDTMGMVFLIILMTFVLSILISCISDSKIKYIYPVIVALTFIPSVYIYYNDSALIHSIWYFVVSLVGMGLGLIINKIVKVK